MWGSRPVRVGLRIFGRRPLALPGRLTTTKRQLFWRRHAVRPPELQREKESFVCHDRVLTDPYAWVLDAANAERVQTHLAAENEYTLKHLRKGFNRPMLFSNQLQEIVKSMPSPPLLAFDYNGFHYYEEEREKKGPVFVRKELLQNEETGEISLGERQLVLDMNEAANILGRNIVAAGFLSVSPCGRFAVVLSQTEDPRTFAIVSCVSSDGKPGQVVGLVEDVLQADWAGDGRLVFVRDAEGEGPRRVLWRRFSKTPEDQEENEETVLYEEKEPRFHLEIKRTRDDRFLTINSNARTTSEVSLLDLSDKELTLKRLWRREENIEYYVDHMSGYFYAMVSEKPHGELQLIRSPDAEAFTKRTNWDLFAERELNREHLMDFTLMAEHCVLHTRLNNQPRFRVVSLSSPKKQHAVAFEHRVCEVKLGSNVDIHAPTFHLVASGPTELPFDVMITLETGTVAERKQTFAVTPDFITMLLDSALMYPFAPNIDRWDYDPSKYAVSRLTVSSSDKVEVPITLALKPNRKEPLNQRPMVAFVYGAYGEIIDLSFRPEFLWFVENGWILSFCHVRGGGELGRKWYAAGQRALKEKTFEDLKACIQGLHANSYSNPSLTALHGFSAGALPVAVMAQRHPTLFKAGVLRSPFVDVLESLRSSDLQAAADRDEFGDVIQDRRAFNRVLSFCPYQTVSTRSYPDLLVTCAEEDMLCSVKNAMRYVGRLRAERLPWDVDESQEDSLLFLKVREGSEHNPIDSAEWSQEIGMELGFLYQAILTK